MYCSLKPQDWSPQERKASDNKLTLHVLKDYKGTTVRYLRFSILHHSSTSLRPQLAHSQTVLALCSAHQGSSPPMDLAGTNSLVGLPGLVDNRTFRV
jgi:hypothetical protein